MFICKYCSKNSNTKRCLIQHELKCPSNKDRIMGSRYQNLSNPPLSEETKEKLRNSKYNAVNIKNCVFCDKKCKNLNSYDQHTIRCNKNPNSIGTLFATTNFKINRKKSNASIKAKETGVPYQISELTREKIRKNSQNQVTSDNKRKMMSEHAKRRNLGGHTSKKSMHYIRKDGSTVYLHSSYEVRFATILDKLDIAWDRPEPLTWIDDAGESHRYYPDFKIGSIYADTKNDYLAVVDARKMELVRVQNNVDLRLVLEKNLTEDFVKSLI